MFNKLQNVLSVKKLVNQPLREDDESFQKKSEDIAFDKDLFKYVDTVKSVDPIDKGYILHEKIHIEIGEYDKIKKMLDELNVSELKI